MQVGSVRSQTGVLRAFVAAGIVLAAFPGVSVAGGASEDLEYHSLINWQFEQPEALKVVVVPGIYFSEAGVLSDTGWLTGGDPVRDYRGVAAVVEAIEYWAWMLALHHAEYPQLAHVSWDLRVVGVDALPQDIAAADIIVVSWMAHGPSPYSFHLGIGLPVPYPTPSTQEKCVVYNSGIGWNADVPTTRLRNLAIHEFGHCISAGHTYDTDSATRLTVEDDVMASVHGFGRQCLSNLNVRSVAEGYRFLIDPQASPGSGWTSIPVEDYAQRCLPEPMERF